MNTTSDPSKFKLRHYPICAAISIGTALAAIEVMEIVTNSRCRGTDPFEADQPLSGTGHLLPEGGQ